MHGKTVPLTLRLAPEQKVTLDTVAMVQGESANDVVRRAVAMFLGNTLGSPAFQAQFDDYAARTQRLFGFEVTPAPEPTTPSPTSTE